MSKKQHMLDIIEDLITDYLYYDRQEDEDLSFEEVEELVKSGEITAHEISECFDKDIRKAIKDNFDD